MSTSGSKSLLRASLQILREIIPAISSVAASDAETMVFFEEID
jgi:hypothetical protein